MEYPKVEAPITVNKSSLQPSINISQISRMTLRQVKLALCLLIIWLAIQTAVGIVVLSYGASSIAERLLCHTTANQLLLFPTWMQWVLQKNHAPWYASVTSMDGRNAIISVGHCAGKNILKHPLLSYMHALQFVFQENMFEIKLNMIKVNIFNSTFISFTLSTLDGRQLPTVSIYILCEGILKLQEILPARLY